MVILSTASGWYTVAQDFGTTSTGIFNETNETPNPYSLSLQSTAFVIGNGTLMKMVPTPLKFYLTAQLPLQVT